MSTGRPLDPALRARAELVFGEPLPEVTVHSDSHAAVASERLSARAFTSGQDVYFGHARYQPDTPEGLRLIGHELTHVVQQRRGLSSAATGDASDPYELEADRGGVAFEAASRMPVTTTTGSAVASQRAVDEGPTSTGAAATSSSITASDPDAEAVGTADSPYDVPYLGEANTHAELMALMTALAAEEGVAVLGLVPEDFAFSTGAEAVAANEPGDDSGGAEELPTAQASILNRPIQRSSVAGCYVQGLPPGAIGILAHQQIQAGCALGAPGCFGEVTIPGDGRADLVRERLPFVPEIGEIKPASWIGPPRRALAEAQLAGYLTAYALAHNMTATPMWSYAFPGGPFWGNPSQTITTWRPPTGGLYFYRCSNPPRRRPVRVPVRVPIPVPVPTPAPSPDSTTARDVARGAAAVGVGIGVGYLVYRGVRLIPSLFPPLWPTLVPNLLAP